MEGFDTVGPEVAERPAEGNDRRGDLERGVVLSPPDLPKLKVKLACISEALTGHSITDGALATWVHALRGYGLDDIIECLDDWADNKVKFPAPAEIKALCATKVSERIEKRARDEALQANVIARADAKGNRADFLKQLGAMVQKMGTEPKAPRVEWAYRIVQRANDGELIPPGVLTMAREAIQRLGPQYDDQL